MAIGQIGNVSVSPPRMFGLENAKAPLGNVKVEFGLDNVFAINFQFKAQARDVEVTWR